MITINLRDFYPWYTHDEFVEIPEEVAEELLADRRYRKAHERGTKRNKAQYSLDAGDGIEAAAAAQLPDSPEAIYEMMERHCRLCQALNSLPKAQGSRIDAHFMLGKSKKEIAEAEGVSERVVGIAIERGLEAMKKYLKNID